MAQGPADAPAAGARRHDPDGAADRAPRRASDGCRPTASSWPCRRAAISLFAAAPPGRCSSPSWSGPRRRYVMIVALPDANQTFREIIYGVVSARAESEVKPRVFFEDFPNLVLYVRDVPNAAAAGTTCSWPTRRSPTSRPSTSRGAGGCVIDREKRTVELVLEDGARHTATLRDPDEYEVTKFDRDRDRRSTRARCSRRRAPQGRRRDDDRRAARTRARTCGRRHLSVARPAHGDPAEVLDSRSPASSSASSASRSALPTAATASWPASCSARRHLRLLRPALPRPGDGEGPGRLRPGSPRGCRTSSSAWPALALIFWRGRSAEQPIRLALPARLEAPEGRIAGRGGRRTPPPPGPAAWSSWSGCRSSASGCRDCSSSTSTSRRCACGSSRSPSVGLLGIFYISTFIDLLGQAVQGTDDDGRCWRSTSSYATPQFVYYIIPLAVLVGALVTIGVLTKNSELVVMKACGISLYRVAAAAGLRSRSLASGAAVRAAGAACSPYCEPAGRGDPPRASAAAAAHLRRRQPPVAGRPQRRHLPLRVSTIRAGTS